MLNITDQLRICGAGILVQENHFYGNIGMYKRTNGGAGIIRCEHLEDEPSDLL